MGEERVSGQPQTGQSGGTGPSSLPDINTQTNPFDAVLYQLNKSANFNIHMVPDAKESMPRNPTDAFGVSGGFGLDIHSTVNRFDAVVQAPTQKKGLRVAQAVGESVGTFRSRWLISPEDFEWSPGKEPPPVLFDPSRSQRFAMLDSEFTFGDGDDRFQGYGVGRTFPVAANGRSRLLSGAVGNITGGSGKFKGLQGTYILNGTITPAFGYAGNVTLRILDWDGMLRADSEIPPLSAMPDPDPQATYIVLRGEKKSSTVRSEYSFGPDGRPQGLITPAQWRSAQYNFVVRRQRGPRSDVSIGQIIGSLDAIIKADLFGPPSTADHPGVFTTDEEYKFVDTDGNTVGTIKAGVVLGQSFDLAFPALPGQPGLRFAGFGPITGGTGPFTGIQGMLSVNSLIGIMPHALSLMHVFRVIDPDGRFR